MPMNLRVAVAWICCLTTLTAGGCRSGGHESTGVEPEATVEKPHARVPAMPEEKRAGPGMKTYSAPGGHFSFSYPPTWIVEFVPEMNGVLLLAPTIEHDWQANMFFE